MHLRTASLFTAMLGLVMLVTGFGALSPSFTLYSVGYSGTTNGAEVEGDAVGALRVDAAGGFVGADELGRDDGVDYRYSADHTDRPTVRIKSVTPEYGEEGTDLRVTLALSRQLTADEKYCYSGGSGSYDDRRKNEVCIEGGIAMFDTYNDHLFADGEVITNDGQHAFVFRGTEVEKRITVPVEDDECITPGRTIRIGIYRPYQDYDEDGNGTIDPDETKYGYDIDTTEVTRPVIGDDDEDFDDTATNNGLWPKKPDNYVYSRTNVNFCENDGTGVTEEGNVNRAPRFGGEPRVFNVVENTRAGVDIGDPVTATDPEDDTVMYSLVGKDDDKFSIDSSTGQIKTKDRLDFETEPNTYHVAVSVTDSKDVYGNSNSAEDDSIDVTINVTDGNEPPAFGAGAQASLSVAENTAAAVDIDNGRFTAMDPDDGDTLTYSLDTGDGAAFAIDATGQIKTKEPLDYEVKDSYTVTVSVTDGKAADGSTDTTADDTRQVTITVTDVNDKPTFGEDTSTTRSVAENTAAGQPVGDPVAAKDDDSGDTLTYSLSGTDSASFDIDTGTGQIKVRSGVDLDYEGGTTIYNVTVSVHDGKDDAGDAETTATIDATIDVTINVTDVNEKPTFAEDAVATLSVEENTAADTNIGAPFTATDPDAADTSLTYSLGGTDAESFAIDASTGQVKTKGDLNHEVKGTYSVEVQVSDGRDDAGTAETPPVVDATHTVAITVTDVDDDGVIALSADPPSAGTTVTATLTDDDGVKTSPAVTWKWETSTDQNSWTVIDGETTDSYTPGTNDIGDFLRVTATYDDELGSGKTAEEVSKAVLTAPPTNLQPEFADATATRSVVENTAAGENIGAPISATHADSKGTLVYSLDATGATNFDIDSSTGQLKTKEALDHETTPSYTVTVSVRDGLTDYSVVDAAEDDTITVTISVTDIVIPAVPGAPTVVATNGAAAGLTVTWTAVAATTTAPVDGYDVQYREKDASPEADWTETSVTTATATITGLEHSTTYEVQVRSKNSEGESAWSTSGEGSIPSRLDVTFSPASLTVDEGSSASFTVTVSPAADRALSIPISTSVMYPKYVGKSGRHWPGFGRQSWSRQTVWGPRW